MKTTTYNKKKFLKWKLQLTTKMPHSSLANGIFSPQRRELRKKFNLKGGVGKGREDFGELEI